MDIGLSLAILVTQDAIGSVLKRYCRAMDRIDKPLGYSVWHPEGIADYGAHFAGTGFEFIDWVCERHRKLETHSHMIGNMIVEIDGTEAVSESYVSALLLTRAPDRHLSITRGRYLDRWSFDEGRWAIRHRTFISDMQVTHRVDDMTATCWGRRDRTDPSYALLSTFAQ